MRRPRRHAKRWRVVLGFSAIVLTCLVGNDQLLKWAGRANPSSRVNWIFQTEQTTHDVVLLGSSLSKEGIDPNQLSRDAGRETTQLAWGGRGLIEQALYFELFLQHHDCKTLVVELHPNGLKQGAFTHPLDEYRYIPRLSDPIVARELKKHFGASISAAWRWVPMWAMAQFSSQIGWHDVLACRRGNRFDPNEAPAVDSTGDSDAMLRSRKEDARWIDVTEDAASVDALARILELCADHGISVVAVYPPMFAGHVEQDKKALQRYRQLLGDTPIVIAGAGYDDNPDFFQDAHHLNIHGSKEFTSELASLLSGD